MTLFLYGGTAGYSIWKVLGLNSLFGNSIVLFIVGFFQCNGVFPALQELCSFLFGSWRSGAFFHFYIGISKCFHKCFVFLLQTACKLSLPRIPPTPVHPCHKVVFFIHFSSQQILCSESDELRVPVSSATVMWGDSYRLMRAHSILVETTAATTAMPQMQKMVIGCHITGSR